MSQGFVWQAIDISSSRVWRYNFWSLNHQLNHEPAAAAGGSVHGGHGGSCQHSASYKKPYFQSPHALTKLHSLRQKQECSLGLSMAMFCPSSSTTKICSMWLTWFCFCLMNWISIKVLDAIRCLISGLWLCRVNGQVHLRWSSSQLQNSPFRLHKVAWTIPGTRPHHGGMPLVPLPEVFDRMEELTCRHNDCTITIRDHHTCVSRT
jgi:hypothetical protein